MFYNTLPVSSALQHLSKTSQSFHCAFLVVKLKIQKNLITINMGPHDDFTDAPVSTGTTIMAVEFDGGVVIGADSRTSSGPYVANRVTDKLTQISDKIYCCRSGSAADTQAIADIVAYSLNYHQNQTSKEPLVWEAASEFRNYCYNYRDSLLAGIIVAGWDKERGGQVYSVPLGGMLTREACTIGGSGSSFIYGFVREHYRPGMPKEECVQFVKKAVQHAIFHDGSSGGVVRVGIITEDGMERRLFYNTESGESTIEGSQSFVN